MAPAFDVSRRPPATGTIIPSAVSQVRAGIRTALAGEHLLRQRSSSPSAAITDLLKEFHERPPLRAWSLIITLYGDAIVPRGGSLWLGSLIDIMALFRIDAGHVRTAMSRLLADGWLEREKMGRNSYYRLSQQGAGSFAKATERIYFGHAAAFDGRLRLALLGPGVDDRSAVRPDLEKAGFVALTSSAYVALKNPPSAVRDTEGIFLLEVTAGDEVRDLACAAWKLTPIAEAYRDFVARFGPLADALARTASREGADTLVARILLIHEFRRIVLRDPGLPDALLPNGWPAGKARALAGGIYRALVPGSESYLDKHAQDIAGPLRQPDRNFKSRFALR